MAKKSVSAFDDLLLTFADEADRQTFNQLAERNPEVLNYGMRQSDYSRRLDEVKDELEDLEKWRAWRRDHYDQEHKMTKTELEKTQQLEALAAEKERLESKLLLEGGGGDMDFEQLEAWGKEFVTKRGIVTTETLKTKEKELTDFVSGMNAFTNEASLIVPFLNRRHEKEFGEMFNPKAFLKEAVDKGHFGDLETFYEKDYVAEARTKKMRSDYDLELKKKNDELAAERERADKAERAAAAGQGGSPVDVDGSTMGAFQRNYLGLNKEKDGSGAPEVELGEGGIAAYAAREFVNRASGRS